MTAQAKRLDRTDAELAQSKAASDRNQTTLRQTDEVLTEGLKDAKRATKNLAKDLAATKTELKAELQEISVRCSVLDSELRTVSVAQAGPDRTTVQEMVVREVTFQCTEHRRTQSHSRGYETARVMGAHLSPFTPENPGWLHLTIHTRSH